MKYSIVIPTLTKTADHQRVFFDCVESVLTKSKDFELIVVDDGSSFPIELVSQPIDTLVTHRRNKGIATSWNDGIKLARGEYIAVVNDDITVQEGWLDKLRQALEMEENYLVAAPGVADANSGSGIEESYWWFPGYCFMVKRETIEKIGLFDEQFSPFNYEDTDYWTRVLKAGGKLVRNYNTTITHIGGDVLHKLKYDEVSETNKQKFIAKWGFDPIPMFYQGGEIPWKN